MKVDKPDELNTLMNAVVPDGVIVAAERLHNLPDLIRHLQLGQLHYVPAQADFLILKPVFRIRDVFLGIRMRIRILGSVPLTNGCGSECGSVPKSSVTFRMQKKYFFSSYFQMFYSMKFKSFKILKICLMTKIKLLARKFFCIISAQYFYGKKEGSGSGSLLVTNRSGCGSGRPKN
jgi:hypothetical protein